MTLNEEQTKAVAAWFAGGASLDEIQKRLRTEFGLHMTYLDLRLLVAELPQPTEEPAEEEESPSPAPPDEEPQTDGALADATLPKDGEEGTAAPTLAVTIDTLTIPGTLASGDVTFSDGQKGKWYLDQMGRLGLSGDLPADYRPSPTDAALFQQQLMQLLQSKGLC